MKRAKMTWHWENEPQCQIQTQQTPESSLAFHQIQNAWVPYGSRSKIDYENEFKNFITHTSTPSGKFHLINLYLHKNRNENYIVKCNECNNRNLHRN